MSRLSSFVVFGRARRCGVGATGVAAVGWSGQRFVVSGGRRSRSSGVPSVVHAPDRLVGTFLADGLDGLVLYALYDTVRETQWSRNACPNLTPWTSYWSRNGLIGYTFLGSTYFVNTLESN